MQGNICLKTAPAVKKKVYSRYCTIGGGGGTMWSWNNKFIAVYFAGIPIDFATLSAQSRAQLFYLFRFQIVVGAVLSCSFSYITCASCIQVKNVLALFLMIKFILVQLQCLVAVICLLFWHTVGGGGQNSSKGQTWCQDVPSYRRQ